VTPSKNRGVMAEMLRRRASQTGLLVGAAGIPYTFQRTLITRTDSDQALVTGLSFLLIESTSSAMQELLQTVARSLAGDDADGSRSWSRYAIAVDIGAIAAGIGAQRLLAQEDGESVLRATGRTTGWFASVVGAGGALVGIGHELAATSGSESRLAGFGPTAVIAGGVAGLREYARRQAEGLDRESGLEPSDVSATKSLALAATVAVGSTLVGHVGGLLVDRVSRMAARVLPGDESRWRPLGHVAVLGAVGWAGRLAAARVARVIEGREMKTEPALDVPPLAGELSGGPGSLVDYDSMSRMGRRFVWTSRRPSEIERIVGETALAYPTRTYVALESAASEEERVQLAMDELERVGAFDRSWLLVCSPTGTGYVNYAAAGAIEFLTRGDCATLAMQYSQRPSPISLDRVSNGRSQFTKLMHALTSRMSTIPSEERPTLVIFGESLGAWTSQDAFIGQGAQGLVDAGIDFAIWIGTPHESEWHQQVGSDGDHGGSPMVGVFDNIDEWNALDPERRSDLRYVMITHTNDGVALFGPELLVQQPSWLGQPPESRPRKIPRGQRWIPITSFVQTLVDTKNAARVVPGKFEAEGHDYRADIVPFFNAVLGFDADANLVSRITQALEEEEASRTSWIAEHGKVGRSMASVTLAVVRERHPDVFLEAAEVVREQRTRSAATDGGDESG
jgi:Alpha/beta-hydrolase family/Alpha/beta-hydrolase family N-terminus